MYGYMGEHYLNMCNNVKLILQLRTAILKCKGLAMDDFKDASDAFKAADMIIKAQRAEFPHIHEDHPDILCPGMKMLDEFWYVNVTGMGFGQSSWMRGRPS